MTSQASSGPPSYPHSNAGQPVVQLQQGVVPGGQMMMARPVMMTPGQPVMVPSQPGMAPGQPMMVPSQQPVMMAPGQPMMAPGQPMMAPGQPMMAPMMVQQPYQPTVVPYPYYVPRIHLPEQFVPNDYLLLTVVVLVLSCILNVTALMFSIPALVSSVYAWNVRTKGMQFYTKAKWYGQVALILDIVTVLWIIGWGIIVMISIGVPMYTSRGYYRYYYYYY